MALMNIVICENELGQTVVLTNGIVGLRHMLIPIKYQDFIKRWTCHIKENTSIHNTFPDLNRNQRDFLLHGCTPED